MLNLDTKSTEKNQAKNEARNLCNLGPIVGGFCKDFGCQVGPSCIQIRSKTYRKINRMFDHIFIQFWSNLGGFWDRLGRQEEIS